MMAILRKKLRGKFAYIKFAARTMVKPLGTVFEVREDVQDDFRRVNRFAYILHIHREMIALTRKKG